MGLPRAFLLSLAATAVLGACGNRAEAPPNLMNLRNTDRTPDEFAILPSAPLEQPEDYAALPEPTPGGANRTDRDPQGEAIAALGGRPDAGAGADAGLVETVTRYGVAADIRGALATEDAAFRRENQGLVLERLFNVNVYYDAYRPQALDQYRELQRLRDAGIRAPAAPPDPEQLPR